ncbi:MAG: hypothetical protein ACRDLN_01855, partial [Solirubrobacteraceae bacterium]
MTPILVTPTATTTASSQGACGPDGVTLALHGTGDLSTGLHVETLKPGAVSGLDEIRCAAALLQRTTSHNARYRALRRRKVPANP